MKKKGTIISVLTLTLISGCFILNGSFNINANAGVEHEYDLVDLKKTKPGDSILQSGDFSNPSAWTLKASDIVTIDGKKYGHLISGSSDSSIVQTLTVEKNKDYIVSFMGKRNITSNYGNVDIRIGDKIIDSTFKTIEGTEFTKTEVVFNSGEATSANLEFVKWEDGSSANVQSARDTEIWVGDVSVKEQGVIENPDSDNQYNFVWAEDFNKNQLDTNNWGYELGHIRGIEQQHYVNDKENVYVDNGQLTIKATDRDTEDQYKVSVEGNEKNVIYNSGSIRTQGKQDFLYGRIEIKAKLPKGQGVFPAFWTLGSNFTLDGTISSNQGYGWPRCGEIDIMELIGSGQDGNHNNRTVYQTLHYGNEGLDAGKYAGNGTAYTIPSGNFNDEYHIFGLNWSKGKMEWYVDDKIVRTVDYSDDPAALMALDKPQYVQLNLALGGSWPTSTVGNIGTDLAGTKYNVDYVYYARNEQQQKDANEYYSKAPQISGAKDVVMPVGTAPDLLASIDTNAKYNVDFSVNDIPMFNNKGGNTNVSLLCKGKNDLESLKKLKVGTYNLYYTAIPKNAVADDKESSSLSGKEDYIFNRKLVTLKVVDVDKTDLNKMIKSGEAYTKDASIYTSYSMQYLVKSLDWGKEISKDQYASQEYINNAYALIQDGIQKLKKKIIQ